MKKTTIIILLLASVLLLSACGDIEETGDYYVYSAVRSYNNGDYLRTIEELEKSLELGLERYDKIYVYDMFGYTLAELGLYDEAIEYYLMILEIDELNFDAWKYLGKLHSLNGDYDEAEELYLKAIELNSEDSTLQSNLGVVYFYKNEYNNAIEYYNNAIEINPDMPISYGSCALCYAMIGDFEKADEYLEESKKLEYDSYELIKERIDELK